MANFGPLRIPFSFANLTSVGELARFISAFSLDVQTNFNNLIATRDFYGNVGSTGVVISGSNFGCSLVATGSYWITLNPSLSGNPVATANAVTSGLILSISGATNTGFLVSAVNASSTLTNTAFHFIAKGPR